MKQSEYNIAKDLLVIEKRTNKVNAILNCVSKFMSELAVLLFENGQFVKPKTYQLLRWWRIGQKTIKFIGDIIDILNGKD